MENVRFAMMHLLTQSVTKLLAVLIQIVLLAHVYLESVLHVIMVLTNKAVMDMPAPLILSVYLIHVTTKNVLLVMMQMDQICIVMELPVHLILFVFFFF